MYVHIMVITWIEQIGHQPCDHTYQIQPGYGDEQADAGRDG